MTTAFKSSDIFLGGDKSLFASSFLTLLLMRLSLWALDLRFFKWSSLVVISFAKALLDFSSTTPTFTSVSAAYLCMS